LLCDLLLLQWAQVLAAILSRDKMARSVDLIDADSEMLESVIFSLFRIQCSRTSMTDKNKKKSNTTQSRMHTQTPKITNTCTHTRPRRYNHGEDLILITNRQSM